MWEKQSTDRCLEQGKEVLRSKDNGTIDNGSFRIGNERIKQIMHL